MPVAKTLTVRQSAEYLDVSTKTIRRYIKRGLLQHRLVAGPHGEEIIILQRSLDRLAGQGSGLSKAPVTMRELSRLFQEAPPEIQEAVLKILRSSTEAEEAGKKEDGFIGSLFRKMTEEFR